MTLQSEQYSFRVSFLCRQAWHKEEVREPHKALKNTLLFSSIPITSEFKIMVAGWDSQSKSENLVYLIIIATAFPL